MKSRNAVLVDGVRSPFARGGRGKLEATRLDEVGALLIKELLRRNPQVKPEMIEDVGIGHGANQFDVAGLGNITKLAGLPVEVTNFMTNRQCGSSMETAQRVAMGIMLGSYDCGLSIGVERMGRTMGGGGGAPKSTRATGFNPRLMEPTQLQRDMPYDHSDYFSVPIPDYILDIKMMQSMVQTGQNVVDMYDITREELDAFSMRSQHKIAAAYDAGVYQQAEVLALEVEDPVFDENGVWQEDEKGPMITFDKDESVRPQTNMEGLAKLPPVRGLMSHADKPLSITAGNSCPTNSGVTCVMLMSEDKALELGLEPLARVVGWAVGGVKQALMGIGPVVAIKKALKHAGLDAGQIDRVEFNEAFAAQVIPTLTETGIPEEKVNVNGGSLGIGHPIGATGARLLMAVGHELRRSGTKYGLATQCIGAGQGIATILENLDAK